MPKILIALVIVFLFLLTVESSGDMLDYFIRPPLTAIGNANALYYGSEQVFYGTDPVTYGD
jgi:hypothetical protein